MDNELVLLESPKGFSSASAGGVSYSIDKKGFFKVQPKHVELLLEHGFKYADDSLDKDVLEDKPKK